LNLNPLLLATAAPPIPEAKAWTADYDGSAGPPIDLSQAVPGYPPPEAMLRALGEAAGTAEACSYGDILGDADLRERYAHHVSETYGGRVLPEHVAITAGCNQAFVVAMLALAKAGDAVMLPSPCYFNHKMTLDMLGIEAVPLPCSAKDGFVPDPDDAARLIDARTRAIVLVTPNNPTGAIYPAVAIEAFGALCEGRGIALVIDETYRDFIGPEPARPHGLLADGPGNVVQLYSFSKAYCIPGHRMGALIADRITVGEIAKSLDNVQICPPRVPQRALVWAIGAFENWRRQNAVTMLDRANAFRSAMDRLDGWEIGSIGGYFAYLRHPYPGRPAEDVAERLARERGVLTLPGSYFGPGQNQFLRVAFANVDASTIAELPKRLADAEPRRRVAAAARG
jgi:aspartate/methionine/tyrosine aminotransferase